MADPTDHRQIRQIQITPSPTGYGTAVTVDGVRIERSLRGYTLTERANHYPVLALDLLAIGATVDGSAAVHLSEATTDLLIRHGWIPPTTPVGYAVLSDTDLDAQTACASTVGPAGCLHWHTTIDAAAADIAAALPAGTDEDLNLGVYAIVPVSGVDSGIPSCTGDAGAHIGQGADR